MTKVSAPYLHRKRGVYYLQKRISKPLIPQYGRSILQRSLRTADRNQGCPMDVSSTPFGTFCGIASMPSNALPTLSTPSVVGETKASDINMSWDTAFL